MLRCILSFVIALGASVGIRAEQGGRTDEAAGRGEEWTKPDIREYADRLFAAGSLRRLLSIMSWRYQTSGLP